MNRTKLNQKTNIMKIKRLLSLSLLALAILASCAEQTKDKETKSTESQAKGEAVELSYADLCQMLTDLEQLATLPGAGIKTAMISSYDRASKYDEKTSEYIDWRANSDGDPSEFLPTENGGVVLGEINGPGVIWRIWSARPESGHVKIYIDGAEEPVIDLPFEQYFDGSTAPFDQPGLVYEAARGMNNYVPISFSKSCKIVAMPGWGRYYHFNYTTFPEGSVIEPFSMEMGQENKNALYAANDQLEFSGKYPYPENEKDVLIDEKLQIKAGATANLCELKGPAAIKSLIIKTYFDSREQSEEMLRKMVIRMRWDGQKDDAVWAPLGDFFGSTPGLNDYKTYTMGMDANLMYAYWFMPFAESAVIEIVNESPYDFDMSYLITHAPLDKPAEQYGHFHAKWHRDIMKVDTTRWPDWTLLRTEGRGRYVGTMLNVWNPRGGSCHTLSHPGGAWWGEGDEKFFIDGEKFPSTFGTGTEDYFGYAWGDPAYYEKPYIAQSYTRENTHQTVMRLHISDNLPFQESFDGYLEKYFFNSWPTQFSAMVYWYLSPDGKDPHGSVPVEQRYGYQTPFVPEYDTIPVPGAIEGEALNILENTGGEMRLHEGMKINIFDLSGNQLLNWYSNEQGQGTLTFRTEAPKHGKYKIKARMVRWNVFGIVQFYINDQEIGEPVDSWGPLEKAGTLFMVELGEMELAPGIHDISIKFVGKNEKCETDVPEMAFDYILFEPVE